MTSRSSARQAARTRISPGGPSAITGRARRPGGCPPKASSRARASRCAAASSHSRNSCSEGNWYPLHAAQGGTQACTGNSSASYVRARSAAQRKAGRPRELPLTPVMILRMRGMVSSFGFGQVSDAGQGETQLGSVPGLAGGG
ncbi:MAG TPA: hypothetical protein VJ370_17105 [Streptosporangiaceae bacterium]|nr:hypothetical protein [Streptosporangiaceae bacterium]